MANLLAGIVCKLCRGSDVQKYGMRKGQQLYWCKACGRRFTDDTKPFGKRFPTDHLDEVRRMANTGMSYRAIADQMEEHYGVRHSSSTWYRWVTGNARKAKNPNKPTVERSRYNGAQVIDGYPAVIVAPSGKRQASVHHVVGSDTSITLCRQSRLMGYEELPIHLLDRREGAGHDSNRRTERWEEDSVPYIYGSKMMPAARNGQSKYRTSLRRQLAKANNQSIR